MAPGMNASIAWNAFVANSSACFTRAPSGQPAVNQAIFGDPRSSVGLGTSKRSRV